MLDELIVTNLGLIADARLEPGPGLVVVTGETGAGKTMLLGALRLLMGGTGRKDLVGPGSDEATVQARIVLDGEEVLVARRLSRTGRSKAYLHGLMAPLKELESATVGAVELVAQHDHLRLTQSAEIRRLLDGELDDVGRSALDTYASAWEQLVEVRARREALGGDQRALQRDLEVAQFQAREIEAAGLEPGEDGVLGGRAARLRNAHGILESLDGAATDLGAEGAEAAIDRAVLALGRGRGLDPQLAELEVQAIDVASLVAELRSEVAAAAADVSAAPDELAAVEERLAVIGDLRRKYGETLADVIAFGAEAHLRSEELAGLLAEADGLDATEADAARRVQDAGAALTAARRRCGEEIAARAVRHLQELGFAQPLLQFVFTPAAAGPQGIDRIELSFASEDQLEPGPVSRIASGGELSRLVLALRLATGASDAAVAAFDEIDAGVGGSIALELGRKLARLAERCQVLCVTHLPQIAAQADTHYVVRRDGSVATVVEVEGQSRVEELARMLAGMPESERGLSHAAELLESAGQAGS